MKNPTSIPDAFYYRLKDIGMLKKEDLKALSKLLSSRREVDQGVLVLREDQHQKESEVIVTGWAMVTKYLHDGRRQIVSFLLPGDLIGLFTPLFGRAEHNIETITPVILAPVSSRSLEALFSHSYSLALTLAWLGGQNARGMEQAVIRLGRRNARERMTHLLMELHIRLRRAGKSRKTACILPLSQTVLSDALGLSRVHTHRVFRSLVIDGVISGDKGEIRLLDIDRLIKISEFEQAYLMR